MNKRLTLLALAIGLLTVVTICTFAYFVDRSSSSTSRANVTDYRSCVAAGFPVQESYPTRCIASDGRSYVDDRVATPENFEGCANLGYPIQESLPRRCTTPDGKSFTEKIDLDNRITDDKPWTVSKGLLGPEKPGQIIITTQKELDKLWVDLQSQTSQTLTKLDVNFKRQVVVGVFAGAKGSGGHDIAVSKITQSGDAFYVTVTETKPGDSCVVTDVITHPYHVVAYEIGDSSSSLSTDNFKFVTNVRVDNCYAD